MGGEIKVQSAPGQGSEFYFNLPLPVAQRTPEDEAVPAGKDKRPKGRVLGVDDDWGSQRVIEMFLRKLRLEPVIVDKGAEGIELAVRGKWGGGPMGIPVPGVGGLGTVG